MAGKSTGYAIPGHFNFNPLAHPENHHSSSWPLLPKYEIDPVHDATVFIS
jgi:hypothetical protein